MTRGRLSLVAAIAVAAIAVVAMKLASSDAPASSGGGEDPSELLLLVVHTDVGTLNAVVGAGGSVAPVALIVPDTVAITIPGQGDATIADALGLPGRTAATATANLLGVWIPHSVEFGQGKIRSIVDRAGGIEVGGTEMTGAEALDAILTSGGARAQVWQTTLQAILAVATWEPKDLPQSDDPSRDAELLNAARGASVEVLPAEDVPGGIMRTDPDTIRTVVTAAWGVLDREVEPVIVLNGSGAPGIGELVAERLIPGGFRIVVSENASSFDHDTTQIVVSSEEYRPLGERVRDLLGVGDVQVAGPASGLADVTIVVGKDFGA